MADNKQHLRIGKLVISLVVVIAVTCGFCYQSLEIASEYFSYPTTTHVSMKNWLPKAAPPKVVICVPFKTNYGMTLEETFSRINDITRVDSVEVKKSETTSYRIMKDAALYTGWYGQIYRTIDSTVMHDFESLINLTTFWKMGSYCTIIGPSERLFNGTPSYSPAELYLVSNEEASPLYHVVFRTNLFKNPKNKGFITIHMKPYHSDMEGHQRTPLRRKLDKSLWTYFYSLTYSSKITQLALPPYDTACRDYTPIFTSQENCISSCLNHFTTGYDFILETSIIHTSKYLESSLSLMPWYFKYFSVGEIHKKYPNISNEIPVANISAINKFHDCKKLCSRPDCKTESLLPKMVTEETHRDSQPGYFQEINLKILPSNDQILLVTSVGKLALIDFIVYIVSCLSFWYGVSPLHASNLQISTLRLSTYFVFEIASKYKKRIATMKQIVIYILVILGFTYQSWEIISEYHKYPTTTLVSLQNSLPVTISPKAVIGFPFLPGWLGHPVRDVFQRLKLNPDFYFMKFRESETSHIVFDIPWEQPKNHLHNLVRIEYFLKGTSYYVSVAPRYPMSLTPVELYTTAEKIFEFYINVNSTAKLITQKKMGGRMVYVPSLYLTSIEADFEGLQLTPANVICNVAGGCLVFITYSAKITTLAQPPYDTSCYDYRQSGFTSKENCLSECLTKMTKNSGHLIESNVLSKERFENSSFILIPWYLRSMMHDGKEVSTELLRQYSRSAKDFQSIGLNVSEAYFEILAKMLPSFKRQWKICNMSCSHPNCYTESLVPEVKWYYNVGTPRPGVQVGIYPPSNPPITTKSEPKFTVLDLVIYLLSCLSFWFGFCPLQFAKWRRSSDFETSMANDRLPHITRNSSRLTRKKQISQISRFLVYLTATAGFSYQSYHICDDYFKYPTSTFVTMTTALPETIAPSVVLNVRFNRIFYGMSASDAFAAIGDNTTLVSAEVRQGNDTDMRSSDQFIMKSFLRTTTYSVTFKTTKPITFSPENIFLLNRPLYSTKVTTNLIGWWEEYFLRLVSHSSDHEGISEGVPLFVGCSRQFCKLDITYSMKITKLAPTPYDTKCRDYGYGSSQEKCFSECLSNFTIKHDMFLVSNVVDRSTFENSSITLIPPFLRMMKAERGQVTIGFLKRKCNQGCRNAKERNMYDELIDILPSYERHWQKCKKYCSEADCHSESFVPFGEGILQEGDKRKQKLLTVTVHPPRDLVIIVESQAKIKLLDFIVYMASCISFWFGWCPLQISEIDIFGLVGKLRIRRRRNNVPQQLFVKVLSQNVHVFSAEKESDNERNARSA